MNENAVTALAIEFLKNRGFVVQRKSDTGLTQTEIIRALEVADGKERDVYEAQGGDYFITYTRTNSFISTSTVERMLTEKLLVLKWPERPDMHSYVLRKAT